MHHVREICDEIFRATNFVSIITVKKTGGMGEAYIDNISDYLIWYAKERSQLKFRRLFSEKELSSGPGLRYNQIELKDGTVRPITLDERLSPKLLPTGSRVFLGGPLTSQTASNSTLFEFEFEGNKFKPNKGGWKFRRYAKVD